ncbi:hypothetical protein DFP72DRAFT_855157 [Ephemerocybe angulata]|uniref:Uncharacterized protein n=1 Tax=Ephemerocybe angulata TaxID=980116 RepID=A0A8H6HHS5_9AGAR|nr:hypothetical protein DFP72DRAFT_855157 [Tulosesus angulatus]
MARLAIADRSLGYELSTEWVNGENHADRDRRRLMGRSKSIRISEERSVRRQRIYSLLHSEHSANAAWAVDITDSGGSDFWTQRMAAPEAITVPNPDMPVQHVLRSSDACSRLESMTMTPTRVWTPSADKPTWCKVDDGGRLIGTARLAFDGTPTDPACTPSNILHSPSRAIAEVYW